MPKPGECHTNNHQTFFRAENDTTNGLFWTSRPNIYIIISSAAFLQRNEKAVMVNTYMACCCCFRGSQNDEDTRTFCGKFLYNAIASTDNAQHKNCPSSGIDDRRGRDLFRVLKRSPISQPHTLGLLRGYSDGKAVGNTTGLRRRLHLHWRISLLQSLYRALGQTEASSNF